MCRPTNYVRRGLTLVELLLAIAMMSILAGVLGGLARAVQVSSEYSHGHALAAQHARVALERIGRAVAEAHAVDDLPGLAVAWQEADGWRFPDTLVVWRPAGAPANPAGPPLVRELVIFCPDPDDPSRLLEITAPTDNRPAPLDAGLSGAWQTELDEIKTAQTSQRIVLTNLLRTAAVGNGGGASARMACIRFERELRPSASEWEAYGDGSLRWDELAWPQDVTGCRQAWVRIELQLMPGEEALRDDPQGQQAIPFFGSSSLHYQLLP